MAKQKMEIKVVMECAKRRSKGLKTAAGLCGVISVHIDGDKIVVIGDGIDPVELTLRLRRKMGFAMLINLSDVVEKKEEKMDVKKNECSKSVQPVICQYAPPPQPLIVENRYCNSDPCCIL